MNRIILHEVWCDCIIVCTYPVRFRSISFHNMFETRNIGGKCSMLYKELIDTETKSFLYFLMSKFQLQNSMENKYVWKQQCAHHPNLL